MADSFDLSTYTPYNPRAPAAADKKPVPAKDEFDLSSYTPYSLQDEANDKGVKLDTAAPVGEPGVVGGIADIGRGLAHGAISDLPRALGKAAQFFGAKDTGDKLVTFAKEQDEAHPDLRQSQVGQVAADDWTSLRGGAYAAGSNTPLSSGPALAGAAAGAGIGAAFGGVGALPGAAAGYVIGSLASLPIFYGSQAQETKEKVYAARIKAGESADQADATSTKAGHLSGAIEAGGELAADLIPFSALAKPFMKPVEGAVVKSMLGGRLRRAAGTVLKTEGAEVGTEMAQQAGEAQVEGAYGAGEGATWKDTASVIVPTALMSLLPGGFAAAHNFRTVSNLRTALSDGEHDEERRAAAAGVVFHEIKDVAPDVATAFDRYAADAIAAGAPISIGNDDTYLDYYSRALASDARRGAPAPLQPPSDTGAGTPPAPPGPPTGPAAPSTPAEEAGIDANAGPLSDAASTAINTGASAVADAQRQGDIDESIIAQREQQAIDDAKPKPKTKAGEKKPKPIEMPPAQPAPGATFPFATVEAATKRAQAFTKQTGNEHIVVPHPTIHDKFAVAPAPKKESDNVEQPAAAGKAAAPTVATGAGQQKDQTDAARSREPTRGQAGQATEVTAPRLPVGDNPTGWVNHNAQAARDRSDKLGLTSRIEGLFADGMTAQQVETQLGSKLARMDPVDRAGFVIGVRATLGIPSRQSAEGKAEFDAWKQAYDKRTTNGLEALSEVSAKAATTRPDAPEPTANAVPVSSPRATPPTPDRTAVARPALSPISAAEGPSDLTPSLVEGQGKSQASHAVPSQPPSNASNIAPLDAAAHKAATSPINDLPEPTGPQALAGNYKVGRVRVGPLQISIENPEGSTREDKEHTPPQWSSTIKKAHYGYVRRSEGADGDHLDVFVKPGTPEDYAGPVYVIDQHKKGGSGFDETKSMIGYSSTRDATDAYSSNYPKGWKVGPVTETTMDEFNAWARTDQASKPFAQYPAKTKRDSERAAKRRAADEATGEATEREFEANKASKDGTPWEHSRDFRIDVDGQPVNVKYQSPRDAINGLTGGAHFEFHGEATSETGYRSDFINHDVVDSFKSPEDYVAARAKEFAADTAKIVAKKNRESARAAQEERKPKPKETRPLGVANNAYLKRRFKRLGIDITERSDITGESGRGAHRTGAMPGTFRKNGMALDDWGESLVTDGWLSPESTSKIGNENVRASADEVRTFMRSVLDGEPVLRIAEQSDGADLEHSAWIEREAELMDGGLTPLELADLADSGLTREENEQAFDAIRFLADSGLTPDQQEAILERAALESTNDATYEQAIRNGAAEASRGDAKGARPAAEETLELTGETNAEVVAREQAAAEAKAKAEAADKAAVSKAQADRERDSFALSGSDRIADEAAAQGQEDLLAQPPSPAEAKVIAQAQAIEPVRPLVRPETSPAGEAPTNIADFGEKIGGARKDVAVPLGKRSVIAKAIDNRPAWARKYIAMPIAAMPDRPVPPNVGKWTLTIADRDGRASSVSRHKVFETEEAALAAIPFAEVVRKHRVDGYKDGATLKYAIFRQIGERKRAPVKGGFATEDAAMRYMAENPVEIIEYRFPFPERPWLDRIERVGPTTRTGNVSTKQFETDFGFRGGEFGNWNMGGDGQAALNHAYDALHDLAQIIQVPPKALSLNGELAIAFGARGHGGEGAAAAHYEPAKVVINLTKIKGAGSLAHEWFHALDDYLSRSTDTAEEQRVRKLLRGGGRPYATYGFGYKSTARPELIQAFTNLVDTMTAKKQGVAIEEVGATRRLLRQQEDIAYKLKNLRQSLTDGSYNRGKRVATTEQLATWDELATKLGNGDGGEQVQVPAPKSAGRFNLGHDSFTHIRTLNDIYKAVTGRSFDTSNDESAGRRLYWGVKSIIDANERVAAAQVGTIEERKTGTEFLFEAKKIDGFRASEYWSTRHEMGARAFESYIFDKLIGAQRRSDYLAYGVENKYYALLELKPYPEGAERTAINAAFERLFQTIEAEPTDRGYALRQEQAAYTQILEQARASGYQQELDLSGDRGSAQPAAQGESAPGSGASSTEPPPADRPFVVLRKTGEVIRVGVDRVVTAEDAAHVFAGIRKSPREVFTVLMTDADGKPVGAAHLFKGAIAQTSVYPAEVIKLVHATPGAKRVWFAHNHPSGVANPSRADELLTANLAAGFGDDLGLTLEGHIVIAGGTYAVMGDDGIRIGPDNLPIKALARTKEIPILDRVVMRAPPAAVGLTSPVAAEEFVAKSLAGKEAGIVWMDSQNRALRVDPTTVAEMVKLRGTGAYQALMKRFAETNAAGLILKVPDTWPGRQAAKNITNAIGLADVRVLDVLVESPDGRLTSLAIAGELPRGEGAFYSQTPSPVDAGLFASGVEHGTAAQVEQWIAPVRRGWKNAPRIVVVQSVAHVPFPVASLRARGVWNKGVVYLIADNLESAAEAQFVLLHEVMGHAGLRGVFGDQLSGILSKIYDMNPSVRALADRQIANAAKHGLKYSKVLATEEALADLAGAGKGQDLAGWKLLVAAIRNALRKLGFDLEINDTDVEAMLARAREFIAQGRESTAGRQQPVPAFSTGAPVWYSTLTEAIANHQQATAAPAQWKGIIARLPNVKREEVEAVGVNEWLELQTGKVTREQLLGYLRNNGVHVEETILGGPRQMDRQGILEWAERTRVEDRSFTGHEIPGLIDAAEQGDGEAMSRLEMLGAPYELLHAAYEKPFTKFADRQLPGGRDYSELLLTLPAGENENGALAAEIRALGIDKPLSDVSANEIQRAGGSNDLQIRWMDAIGNRVFRSGHFEQPNILAHIRFNARLDPQGKRVLFIEEIQSDWAQKGRREGFVTAAQSANIDRQMNARSRDLLGGSMPTVPSAPFVGKTEAWTALALKRMIRYAAEHNFDRIAWANGDQQVARYDLSKQVGLIEYTDSGMLLVNGLRGESILREDVPEDRLAERIGKEAAEKLLQQTPRNHPGLVSLFAKSRTLSGVDLQIGGEGMKAFYDRIVPNIANDVLKKLGGGRVIEIEMNDRGPALRASATAARSMGMNDGALEIEAEFAADVVGRQMGFDITDALRDAALQGMPLFSLADTSLTGRATQMVADTLLRSPRQFNPALKNIQTQYHKAQTNRWYWPVFDSAQRYLRDVSKFAIDAADRAPDLLPRLGRLRDVLPHKLGGPYVPSQSDIKAVGRTTFAITLAEKLPTDEQLLAGVTLQTDAGAVDIPSLTPEQLRLYKQVRGAINLGLDQGAVSEMSKLVANETIGEAVTRAKADPAHGARILMAALEDRARTHDALGQLTEAKHKRIVAEQVEDLASDAQKLKREGYAPLMRFGQYTVYVSEMQAGALVQRYFGMFESKAEMYARARDMQELYPNATVTTGTMDQAQWELYQGLSLDSLAAFAETTGFAKDPLFQDFYKLALSSRSALKRLIHRKGIEGYDEDIQRVLASFVTSQARLASKNWHFGNMLRAATSIPVHLGDVRTEAAKLVKYVQNPVEEASSLRGLLFVNFLGGSVAAAMVNATQPFMMTAPYLSQYSNPVAAFKALGSAMKQSGHPTDPALIAALDRAGHEGVTEPQELHQLYAESIRGLGRNLWVRRGLRVWGSLFAVAESFNRRITFIAAFRMAQDVGLESINAALERRGRPTVLTAYEFAEHAVEDTQGIYNRGNRPNAARGALGATVFTFKQFSIAYIEFLSRLPPREKALAGALLIAAAGLQGAPGADDLEDLIDTIGQMMGYNTNSKKWLREKAVEILGDTAGGLLTHGFSALPGVPLDVQQRLGVGNLLPGTALFKQSDAGNRVNEIAEFFGPIGGVYSNIENAFGAAVGGRTTDSLKAIAPTAVQNMAKAFDMWASGQYKDTKNRKVIDTTPTDAAVKFFGFQPQDVAIASRKAQDVRQDTAMVLSVRINIADRMARAVLDRDFNAVREARMELMSWNTANPAWPIVITPMQIREKVRNALQERSTRLLKSVPKEIRGEVAQGLR